MSQPPSIQNIALSQLTPSATQPRKNFREQALADLAASIRDLGVIQPLNVRRAPGLFAGESESTLFEIIFGERRFRASRIAGLEEVPCIVREWSDRQVIEAQWIENLQRDDLDPIEESEGYHALLELRDDAGQPTYDVERIAAMIKKTVEYVYPRLRLRDLPPIARDALLKGDIKIRLASIIARIPEEATRTLAAHRIIKPEFQESPLTTRQAEEMVKRYYMRSLKAAPFDTDDAGLVPSMGPCGPCPYRSGNAPLGFGEMSGHLCTNPECFRLKTDMTWTRAQEAARAEGKRILTTAESEKIFQDNGTLDWTSPFIRVNDQPAGDLVRQTTKRLPRWIDLLKKSPAKVEICVGRAPGGSVHEVALLSYALAAAREVKPELFIAPKGQSAQPAPAPLPSPAPAPTAEKPPEDLTLAERQQAERIEAERRHAEEQKDKRLKTVIDLAVLRETLAALVKEIDEDQGETGPEPAWCYWTSMLPLVLAHAGEEARSFVANRRGMEPSLFDGEPIETAQILEGEISIYQMPGLFAELLLAQYVRWQGGENSSFLAPMLEAFEIDAKAIRKQIEDHHKQPKAKSSKPKTLTEPEITNP